MTTLDAAAASDDLEVTWLDDWDQGEPVLLDHGLGGGGTTGTGAYSRNSVRIAARWRAYPGDGQVNRTARRRLIRDQPTVHDRWSPIVDHGMNGMSLTERAAMEEEVTIPAAMCGFDNEAN